MLYWFQVYLLVAISIFSFAGAVLLTLMAGSVLKQYIRVRWAAWHVPRTPIAKQRVSSPLQQAS